MGRPRPLARSLSPLAIVTAVVLAGVVGACGGGATREGGAQRDGSPPGQQPDTGQRAATQQGVALRLDFDAGLPAESTGEQTEQTGQTGQPGQGTGTRDVGDGRRARIRTGAGGRVELVSRDGGHAVRFPAPCEGSPCPNALVEVPDGPGLDPGARPFAFGATVRVDEADLTDGSNIVQKGRYAQPGGQWKLQLDNRRGRVACVVTGTDSGQPVRAQARAETSVADGSWHRVACRKAGGHLSVAVDGREQERTPVPITGLSSDAPVRVGSNAVGGAGEADQFHGAVDDVFLRIG